MTPEEQDSLYPSPDESLIKGSDLKNQKNRTLIWGCTTGRRSWHVYLKDGGIYSYAYGASIFEEPAHDSDSVTKLNVRYNEDYVPNKRLYPECCDYEFCKLLMERGAFECATFTTRNDDREPEQFYGRTFNE